MQLIKGNPPPPAPRPVFLYVLGRDLDGGALQLMQRMHQLPGLNVVPPFTAKNIDLAADYIGKLPATLPVVYAGDGCGANLFGLLQAKILPRKIAAACLIRPSLFCGKYPILGNCLSVELFYGDFLSLPLPGSGCYKIPPADWAPSEQRHVVYPGYYLVNGGATMLKYIYAAGRDPGDDTGGIQAMIVARVEHVLASAAVGGAHG